VRLSPASPSSEDLQGESGLLQGQSLPASWAPDVYAKWFFDFLKTDLTTLTPGQLLGMRADVWVFVRPEIVVKSWGDERLPPKEMLEALQRDAREGIQHVREGGWFALEAGITYGIARLGERIIRGARRGTFEDLFRAAAMDTLQAYWDRLYECPRCHALFVKVGKQKYCSPTCASRAHWEKFKMRRKARDHRREYARRTQKRLGGAAKVKIAPRKRT
jgi:hypothetical protein